MEKNHTTDIGKNDFKKYGNTFLIHFEGNKQLSTYLSSKPIQLGTPYKETNNIPCLIKFF